MVNFRYRQAESVNADDIAKFDTLLAQADKSAMIFSVFSINVLNPAFSVVTILILTSPNIYFLIKLIGFEFLPIA